MEVARALYESLTSLKGDSIGATDPWSKAFFLAAELVVAASEAEAAAAAAPLTKV